MSELQLQQTEQRLDGVAEVRVSGEIDMASAGELRDLLDRLVDEGAGQIVLDCRGLEFLDSSGIGVLVAARKRLSDDGSLVIDSPPQHVRKVLDITGVIGHLTVR